MDQNESRLLLVICACMFAFVLGVVGFAYAQDEVKERVDRRVDQRICQLVPNVQCPPPAPVRSGRD